jgi:CspA family cold shock protein
VSYRNHQGKKGIPIQSSFRKETSALAKGTVKWFSKKKGYGFIEQDGGQDIFVHYSSIDMPGFKTLNEGDQVTFEVEVSDRGPEAKNVRKS